MMRDLNTWEATNITNEAAHDVLEARVEPVTQVMLMCLRFCKMSAITALCNAETIRLARIPQGVTWHRINTYVRMTVLREPEMHENDVKVLT